jgi:outer membrane protein OmpA-like peptidoglycan-associated protein
MDFVFSRFEIVTGTAAAFLGLLFLCVFVEAGQVQSTIAVNASEAVTGQPLYWSAVEARGRQVVLSGAAPDDATRRRAVALAVAARGVAGVRDGITVVGAAGACQQPVDAVLRASPVLFRPGRAELLDSSFPVLRALADALNGCDAAFEVASHTDDRGDAAVNRTLSQRRAELVAAELVRSGVAAERLRSVGYGSAQPLAAGHDPDARAANRRLELRVIDEAGA